MVFSTIVRSREKYVPTSENERLRDSAFEWIRHGLRIDALDERHHKELLSIGLWKWTEAAGIAPHAKYNLRFVSEGVLDPSEPTTRINHEHVFTRKSLIEQLRRTSWTDDDLREFLEDFGVSCTVTVPEHGLLCQSTATGWERYAEAGVRVFDRLTQTWLSGSNGEAPVDVPSDESASSADPATLPAEAAVVLIKRHANSDLVRSLVALAESVDLFGAAVFTQQTSGSPSYVRVHDVQMGEPVPAIAYVNFNGNVDVALQAADLLDFGDELGRVSTRSDKRYGVRCRVDSTESIKVAQVLLDLALEKQREELAV